MSWLTKFLGFDLAIQVRDREIDYLRDQRNHFYEVLELKDKEIRRLTDLMLIEHGVIHPEGAAPEKTEAPRSINRRPSWNQVKTRYEEADAKLASEQSGALRDYWLKKSQEAMMEGKVI